MVDQQIFASNELTKKQLKSIHIGYRSRNKEILGRLK